MPFPDRLSQLSQSNPFDQAIDQIVEAVPSAMISTYTAAGNRVASIMFGVEERPTRANFHPTVHIVWGPDRVMVHYGDENDEHSGTYAQMSPDPGIVAQAVIGVAGQQKPQKPAYDLDIYEPTDEELDAIDLGL